MDFVNVTEIDDDIDTNVSESEGDVEETFGARLADDCVGLVTFPMSSALQDKSNK
jgi:hypothetical protein|tara:strand:+ start:350 stop:514 length:165 start_codon:yes stop_codon:yes gene_type:complete